MKTAAPPVCQRAADKNKHFDLFGATFFITIQYSLSFWLCVLLQQLLNKISAPLLLNVLLYALEAVAHFVCLLFGARQLGLYI